jgi:hypothetical protein
VDEETSFLDFVLRGAGSWIVFGGERKDAFWFSSRNYWLRFVVAGNIIGDWNVRGVQYFEEQFFYTACAGNFTGDRRKCGNLVWDLVRIGKPAQENASPNAPLTAIDRD